MVVFLSFHSPESLAKGTKIYLEDEESPQPASKPDVQVILAKEKVHEVYYPQMICQSFEEERHEPGRLYYHMFLFDRRDAANRDERKTLARTRPNAEAGR
ncbi:MAG: hypothetical protein ACXWOL_05670 [Ktedonobacteraceae bacterium]